ncbi:hypothetical protein AWB94_33565 [Mycolicibacterium canariasense]|nr:hypothetical protein AWB94_33565 [Mycolicibacterium canariasense]
MKNNVVFSYEIGLSAEGIVKRQQDQRALSTAKSSERRSVEHYKGAVEDRPTHLFILRLNGSSRKCEDVVYRLGVYSD